MERTCSVEGCDRPYRRKGYCEEHAREAEAHLPRCAVETCDETAKQQGLCSMHAARKRRHGHPLATYYDRFNRYETTDIGTPRLIMLNRDFTVETTVLFDERDEAVVRSRHWHLSDHGYVISFTKDADGRRFPVRMHREVLGLGEGDGLVVDHINGTRTDNRRHNLRVVPHQINASNREVINGNGSSRYRGVSWDKRSGCWAAYAKVDYRKRHLGKYVSEEEAAAAVARFRRENGLPVGW